MLTHMLLAMIITVLLMNIAFKMIFPNNLFSLQYRKHAHKTHDAMCVTSAWIREL